MATQHDLAWVRSEDGSRRWLEQPLWVVAAQCGVFFSIFLGFGAAGLLRPKLVILLAGMCLVAAIALGPVRRSSRIVVTGPVVAIVGWWMSSYLWTVNVYGWWTDTQKTMPTLAICVALAGILSPRQLRDALVASCYVTIGYTVLQIVVYPGTARVNPDGVAGWRGGFIHKNAMAPFLIFAVLTLMSFDRPSNRRRVAVLTALGLIAASQSTSALSAGLAVTGVYLFLHRFARSHAASRASLLVGASFAIVSLSLVFTTIAPGILQLRGKDTTLSRRTDIWNSVWDAIITQPWQGYGIGGVWSDPSVEPGQSIIQSLGFPIFHSHDGYLEILLTIGIVGLVLFAWLIASTMRMALANLNHDPPFSVFVASFVTLVVVYTITEIAVFGIWLALLSTLHCLLVRSAQHRVTGEAEA